MNHLIKTLFTLNLMYETVFSIEDRLPDLVVPKFPPSSLGVMKLNTCHGCVSKHQHREISDLGPYSIREYIFRGRLLCLVCLFDLNYVYLSV